MREFKHLVIEEFLPPAKRRTKCFRVTNKYDSTLLGVIEWYIKWRKYAFYPEANTLFEEDCLRDLADFCIEETKKQKGFVGSIK